MIWHIFKKDLRLLWPTVVVVAGIHALAIAMSMALDVFREPASLRLMHIVIPWLSLVGVAALTIGVFHQDAVPGVTQDWLIRPIKRTDLLFAKLVFVLLMVLGPLLIADICVGLAQGLTVGPAIRGAMSRNIAILFLVAAPAMIVGSVTANAAQALVTIVAIIGGCFGFVLINTMLTSLGPGLAPSGLTWMVPAVWSLWFGVAGILLLPFQFRRRKTLVTRVVTGGVVAIAVSTLWLPWPVAFALQRELGHPAAANNIAVAFAPAAGQLQTRGGAAPFADVSGRVTPPVEVFLPIEFSGLKADDLVLIDRLAVRIVGDDGGVLYEGQSNAHIDGTVARFTQPLAIRPSESDRNSTISHQRILIPERVYREFRDRSLEVELNYLMTLLQQSSSTEFAVPTDGRTVPDLGYCATRIEGDARQLACVGTRVHSCFTAMVTRSEPGPSPRKLDVCDPSYGPIRFQVLESLSRFAVSLREVDGKHEAADPSSPQNPEILFRDYKPRAHFTREVRLASIRLDDWKALPRD